MTSHFDNQKKRPSPIDVSSFRQPSLPQGAGPPDRHERRHVRNTSGATHQGQRSAESSALTTPVDPAGMRLPPSGSGRSRNAMATFANFIEQSRVTSPRKSDQGHDSTAGSRRGSTARSRQSGRSQQSAAAIQAQLEALDEETARGKIESRSERNMFKMTGQVPPTPTTGTANEDDVYIRTEDLRSQCRAASEEVQPDRDEPVKSPKKKLFQNIRNQFSKSSGSRAAPPMPSKAAQVFGTAARQPHVIQVRPIKPARAIQPSPTRPFRSDTARSLPAKIAHPDSYAHRHRSGTSRRTRAGGPGSPVRDSPRNQSSDAENTPPVLKLNASFDSVIPPTPPAKDTPPDQRPASPLRRVAPAQDLRENYDTYVDKGAKLRFPDFDLSPLPMPAVVPSNGGASPTKFRPYNAEDYTKLIGGEALQWPYPDRTDSPGKLEEKRSAPLEGAGLEALQLPRPDGKSEKRWISTHEQGNYSPLQPRFYSPKHLSAHGFLEGESPSKNSDTSRMLYLVPSKSISHLHLREDSNNGSIEMIFQGDPRDIDPNSPTARELGQNQQQTKTDVVPPDTETTSSTAWELDQKQQQTKGDSMRSATEIKTRVMQELRIGEQSDNDLHHHGRAGRLQPDQSSSRLTDMLNIVSPGRDESHGDFRPYCLSAVPSPLHRAPVPVSSARSMMPSNGNFRPFPPPLSPKSIDDHFFMTNEHLDVMGKTTWDRLEDINNKQKIVSKARHDQLVALVNKRFDDLKPQLDTVADEATRIDDCMVRMDRIADNQHNIYATVNSLKDSVKESIPASLAEQDKKMANVEADVKELKQMVQALQKSAEQKAAEPKNFQQCAAAGPNNTPNRAYPQSLTGYPGPGGSDISNLHDNRGSMCPEGQNDARLGYQNGQHWTARPGYLGRNGKEDRPSYPTNPYHYASGGQYSSGYSGTYSPFSYSPSSPDQQYPFNNHGPAK